jgi:hypothetical protein
LLIPLVGGVFALGVGVMLLDARPDGDLELVEPAYFKGETLPRRSFGEVVLVPATGSVVPTLGLPDSRFPATVIAPDLSNFPPGFGPEDAEPAKDIEQRQEERRRNDDSDGS